MKLHTLVLQMSCVLVLAVASGLSQSAEYTLGKDELIQGLLEPFWSTTTMHGEGLFFIEPKPGQPAQSQLLFVPEKVLRLKSASGEIDYIEGKDYTVDKANRLIKLLPGSRIPFKKQVDLFPPADSKLPKIGHKRGDPKLHLMFGEGHYFHDQQEMVTYTHAAGAWTAYVPAVAEQNLTRTLKKLRGKEPLKLNLLGDSISQGYNASKFVNVAPFQPGYGELVAAGIEKAFGSKVEFKNFAIAGWTTDNGLAKLDGALADKPDLIIIAFGMNDSGGKPPEQYAANTKKFIERIRAVNPDADFILVSSMLPNPEWSAPRLENFPKYREELLKLCGSGVALADVTSVWSELLKSKTFYDVTGNGVNHPNDFGHRLYAQTILGLLTAPAK